MPVAATSGSSTSGPKPSPTSSRSSGQPTRSSCSTASTAASATATLPRSASLCWRSASDPSAPDADPDPLRQPCDPARQGAGPAALILEPLAAKEGRADDRPPDVAKRLGRDSDRRRLDDRQAGDLVAAVQRQRGKYAACDSRGRDAVAGVAKGIVDTVTFDAADHRQVCR